MYKKPMEKTKKTIKIPKFLLRILIVCICLGILGVSAVAILNGIVVGTTQDNILTPEEAAKLEDLVCILVLGCLVHEGGTPSDMLSDRLRRGVELYDLGAAPKLLMSGDHGRTNYDEVDAMRSEEHTSELQSR